METKNHWLGKLLASSTILFGIVILAIVGVVAFFGHKAYGVQMEMKVKQDMILANMSIINEQQIVSDILHEKLGKKLSVDQIAKLTFTIIDGGRRNGIPRPLILGLIEKESTWNPKALSGNGAIGLMQDMPDTAIRHFKQRGLTFSIEALYDPILNVSIGIDILADKQETAIAQGKTTKDDFIWALYYYCGKGDAYAREVIALGVAYKKRLDTPIQDIIKKNQDMDRLEAITKDATETEVTETKGKKVAKK